MKKVIAILVVLMMVLACAACSSQTAPSASTAAPSQAPAAGTDKPAEGGAAPQEQDDMPYFELRLGNEYPVDDHQTVALQDGADKVYELTNGHVKITVYPNLQLGDYTVVFGQVMSGDIDMCSIPIAPSYDTRTEVLNFPFLATSYEEFAEYYLPGSYIWDLISDVGNSTGVTLLGIFNSGFMGIGSASFPAEDFATLTDGSISKNTLIRTPHSNAFQYTIAEMGYRTTSIAYADLYSALQSGVADGWIGGSGLVNYQSFRDVIKYFIDVRAVNECLPVVINTKTLESMPEEYQKIIKDVYLEMALRVADERQAQEEQALVDLRAYGINVIEPTDEELSALRDREREVVWNKMRDIVGNEIIDNLCDAYGVAKIQ